MRIKLLLISTAFGLTLMSLTACGSGSDSDDGGGVASLSEDSGSDSDADSGDSEEEALQWARCMRDEGVDIPDPETDADGSVRLGRVEVGPGGDIDPEAFQAAIDKCGEPPGREMSEQDQSKMQDAALEFAKCMRDKGYDFPDPTFDEHGGMMFQRQEGGGELDPNDPQVQKDMNECQEAFEGLGPEGDS